MGIFDNELILPGTITEIVSDYSYGYDTSLFGTTDSVTIVGTAFNGPVGKPVEIYSPEHAKYIFGETYDYKTRRESTLVAEIQDTWDRGCRTIYAVRVSGKDIFKDFQLAVETKLKLRMSGIFPSNDNKDIFFVYDDTEGASKVKIYKPAKRATIEEKLQGFVENDETVLVTTLEISNSYGLTKDSRLVELVKVINEHRYNNVLRLSIVDEKGNDVTISSKEAQSLSVGSVFAGAYFIGRDTNNCISTTNLTYVFADKDHKPYSTFDGMLYKKLIINTDVATDLPIYGESVSDLNDKFVSAGVSMTNMFDVFEVTGAVDQLFVKDTIDYEEVEISDFDLYKRLGSGFAVTAKAELKGSGPDIKVKETPVSDSNRIMSIKDGIYSMLENLKSNYRILTNGVADTAITGKIPRKSDFMVSKPSEIGIIDNKVVAKSNANPKDLTEPKKYKFVLDKTDSTFGQSATIKPVLFKDKVIKNVAVIADESELIDINGVIKNYENGTLFMVVSEELSTGTLIRYSNGSLTTLDDSIVNGDLVGKFFKVGDTVFKGVIAVDKVEFQKITGTEFGSNEYVLVDTGASVAVYAFNEAELTLAPVGALSEVFNDDEDKTLITVESVDFNDNLVTIKSSVLDYTTLEEFVEILNTNKDISKLFTFSIHKDSVIEKDEYVEDVVTTPSGIEGAAKSAKTLAYDTSMYIPYKTTDNFARHLAQHCTYTSLKTAPTHGVIGCAKLLDVNLNSIAKKVEDVASLDLNLYAKKSNGRDMLDRNNLPYPIGRNVSVVVGQYVVNMGDGYTYVSNGASGYAGMVSILPLDQSSTSQPIRIPNPMYELTNYQLEKLTQKGFITFKQSYTKGFVVTDGVTMAPVTSQFRRLSVTRIVGAVEEIIRAAVEPFIGKQNHLANRNSMQTAIKSNIEKVKDRLIEDFDFKLVVDPAAVKLGIVDIDYSIIPIYEIREVRNRISVKESL